jgi:hypothetical protein
MQKRLSEKLIIAISKMIDGDKEMRDLGQLLFMKKANLTTDDDYHRLRKYYENNPTPFRWNMSGIITLLSLRKQINERRVSSKNS